MTFRILALSLCLALTSCLTEEELAETDPEYDEPQLRPFDLQEALPAVLDPSEAEAAALDGEAAYEEEVGEDLEPAGVPAPLGPVGWTVTDSQLRSYLVWQRYLDDSLELSKVARAASEALDLPADLRASSRRFENPEMANESFSRFGLTREEAIHIESLVDAAAASLGYDPLPLPEQLTKLGRDTGSSAREFLRDLRLERERLVRERLDPLRSIYGDANVDLVLRNLAALPSSPHRLEGLAGEVTGS